MSIEAKFKRKGEDTGHHPSDMVLTITLVGAHDFYRFAHVMLTGQTEFGQAGRKILAGVKRRMGTGRWSYLDRSMGGWHMCGEREPREVQP